MPVPFPWSSLPRVDRRTRRLADGGVEFRLNFEVGRDASLAELHQRHDALLIATVMSAVLFRSYITQKDVINQGTAESLTSVMATGSTIAFGSFAPPVNRRGCGCSRCAPSGTSARRRT